MSFTSSFIKIRSRCVWEFFLLKNRIALNHDYYTIIIM